VKFTENLAREIHAELAKRKREKEASKRERSKNERMN
jgi:hypothetical protein